MSYAKHILYLVDACYGGLTLATTRGIKKDNTPEYIKKMTMEKGRQVITAGGKGEQVIEKPEWGHSAFTKSLLKGLGEGFADENMDGIISADELGSFIKNRVVVDVDGAHTPQKGRIGSDMGEFVFISETLEEQVASADSGDDVLDDIKSQMAAQQKQMAQLTEILLAQAEQVQKNQAEYPVQNHPNVTPESKKPDKPKQPANMKTVSTLAWAFPGMGHYYSGRTGKGILFTVLELSALMNFISWSSKVGKIHSNYATAIDERENATANKWSEWNTRAEQLLEDKNTGQIWAIASGTASIGIWLWNVHDLKKNRSTAYLHKNKFSVGFNPYGQVEARIKF